MYYLYIVECVDKSLYTGIAKDLTKRILEHNESSKGAKYTKNKRPVKLVYYMSFQNRSDATKEEIRVKKLSRNEKLSLIKSFIFDL
jgi:putative endonuclease